MNPTQSGPRDLRRDSCEGAAGDLRAWARGPLATEAAVELLLGACHGHLAEPGWPWLPSNRGRIWLDATKIATATGGPSAGEVRILSIIESPVIGVPLHDLAGLLSGLDPLAPSPWFSPPSDMLEAAGSRSTTGSSKPKIIKAVHLPMTNQWDRTHSHQERKGGQS